MMMIVTLNNESYFMLNPEPFFLQSNIVQYVILKRLNPL